MLPDNWLTRPEDLTPEDITPPTRQQVYMGSGNSIPTANTATNTANTATGYTTSGYTTYGGYWSYYPRIELTLSEVNKLRTLARKNAGLRTILNKFAPYIHLTVDF